MNRQVLEEARLIILKELDAQSNKRMTSAAMCDYLRDVWWIDKERGWVEQQFSWLEEMRAVTIVAAGTVKIACLTEVGARHLRYSSLIPGVKAPSMAGE